MMDSSNHSIRSGSSGRSIYSVYGGAEDNEQERKKREQKRRKYELRLIKKFDSVTINVRRDCWFLIDCRWLDAWAEYVQYIPPKKEVDESDHTDGERSISSQLGGAEVVGLENSQTEIEPVRPGPLSTRDLLSADGKTPLPDLRAKVDYRGVPSMVYCIFVELYGRDTSPEICRYVIDIYKVPVPEDRLVQIKLNAVPRATIEVNKIRSKLIKREIDRPEDGEEDLLDESCCCCCCLPCFRGIRKEHIEAFIYWAIICWTSCCMGGRKRHGRGDISYSKYTPLKAPAEDQSTLGGGEWDGAGSRSRSSSISSSRSRVSNTSAASKKSTKSRQSSKSEQSKKSSKSVRSNGSSKGEGDNHRDSSSDSENGDDEFHAGPADRNEDQREWVRSLLWR